MNEVKKRFVVLMLAFTAMISACGSSPESVIDNLTAAIKKLIEVKGGSDTYKQEALAYLNTGLKNKTKLAQQIKAACSEEELQRYDKALICQSKAANTEAWDKCRENGNLDTIKEKCQKAFAEVVGTLFLRTR
jgi:hypothetical protein